MAPFGSKWSVSQIICRHLVLTSGVVAATDAAAGSEGDSFVPQEEVNVSGSWGFF